MITRRIFAAAPLALAALPLPALAAPRTLSGTVSYRERIALPPGAVVEVSLLDVSLADTPSRTVARTRIAARRQVPIPYRLRFNDTVIRPGHRYALRAEIRVRGQLWFTTTEHHAALVPEASGEIVVQRVAPPAEVGGPTGSWRVESLRGRPLPEGARATLQIDSNGRVSAHGGCNGMGGQATIRDRQIRFGPLVGTMMACPEPRMQVENQFRTALEATRSWRMERGALTLLSGRGARLVELARE
ncbi:YbaY family lipoprotein [Bosea sp. NPDC003192]|uniref:YbaY family lipoprotein n=1 Tax=Bosea sp. NPDC003192 TaxID=3390551 RepID=UPI003D08B901